MTVTAPNQNETEIVETPGSVEPVELPSTTDTVVFDVAQVVQDEAVQDEVMDSETVEPTESAELTEAIDDVPAPDEVVEVPTETCPKCRTTTPWKASSWCPDCGYYPGVTDAIPASESPVEVEQVVTEAIAPPPMLAPWITKSIAGPTTIIVLSIAARYYFTYYGGNRGLVALLLFLVGGLAFFVAHLRTSLVSINEMPDCGLFDMIVKPIEMWRPTVRGLPKTGNRIVMGVSGGTAMLAATLIIGGIDFGSLLDRDEIKQDKNKPGIIKQLLSYGMSKAGKPDKRNQPESIEDALDQIASPIPELDPSKAALLPSPDDPLKCVVYGFMKDGKEDFGRILLAATIKGKRVHVGTIDASTLPKHARENLAARFQEIVTDKTSMESPYAGTWVTPTIGLPISFDKWSYKGELVNPEIGKKKKTKSN